MARYNHEIQGKKMINFLITKTAEERRWSIQLQLVFSYEIPRLIALDQKRPTLCFVCAFTII